MTSSSSSTSSKRPATESKSSLSQCNGIRLTASGRRLPFVLEAHIVSFADAAELAALLDTSKEMQALVHDWLRTTPRLVLSAKKSAKQARLAKTARIRSQRLQELTVEVWIVELHGWLASVIAANSATLRKVSAPARCWTSSALGALVACSDLRVFDCANAGALGESQMRRLADNCTKLEAIVLPDVLQPNVQRALLCAPLVALAEVDLSLQSLDELAPLATHPKLTSLTLRVSSSVDHFRAMTAVCDQLLPKLTKLRYFNLHGAAKTADIAFTRTLSLPALTKLHWHWPTFVPLLSAPNCEELHVSSLTDAAIAQLAAQLPSLRAFRVNWLWHEASDAEQLFRDPSSGRMRWPQLQEISSNGRSLSVTFCNAAASWPELRLLDVALESTVSPRAVQNMLAHLPKLERVHISVRGSAPAPDGASVCLQSPTAVLRALEHLSLEIADDELLTSFELPALKRFDLRGSTLRVEHLQRALELMPSLQHLSLYSTTVILSAPCARPLLHLRQIWLDERQQSLEFLLKSCPNVEFLRLPGVTPESLEQLSTWDLNLPRLSTIEAKDIWPCPETITALIDSLPSLRSLALGASGNTEDVAAGLQQLFAGRSRQRACTVTFRQQTAAATNQYDQPKYAEIAVRVHRAGVSIRRPHVYQRWPIVYQRSSTFQPLRYEWALIPLDM